MDDDLTDAYSGPVIATELFQAAAETDDEELGDLLVRAAAVILTHGGILKALTRTTPLAVTFTKEPGLDEMETKGDA